jgi:hypothetical protein
MVQIDWYVLHEMTRRWLMSQPANCAARTGEIMILKLFSVNPTWQSIMRVCPFPIQFLAGFGNRVIPNPIPLPSHGSYYSVSNCYWILRTGKSWHSTTYSLEAEVGLKKCSYENTNIISIRTSPEHCLTIFPRLYDSKAYPPDYSLYQNAELSNLHFSTTGGNLMSSVSKSAELCKWNSRSYNSNL